MVTVTKTEARLTVPVELPKHPDPIGTPPGGGEWTWDTQVGQWIRTDLPADAGAQQE